MKTNKLAFALLAAASCLMAVNVQAAYLIQVDTDGADDGPISFPANFSFGNGGTTASTSSHSAAVGLAPGDSIFGGDGTPADQYIFTYDLDVDGDNTPIAVGTPLNGAGDVAGGMAAGGSGRYKVYATWPFTSNVSGGDSNFALSDDLTNSLFNVDIDQNNGGAGSGNEWILLGDVTLDAARTYTLTQTAGDSSFVSQRIEGILFDRIPEPTTAVLAALSALGVAAARRRR